MTQRSLLVRLKRMIPCFHMNLEQKQLIRTMYYEWIAGRHEPKLSSVMMLQRALRVAIALKGKTGMAVIRANEAEKMDAEKEGSGDAP